MSKQKRSVRVPFGMVVLGLLGAFGSSGCGGGDDGGETSEASSLFGGSGDADGPRDVCRDSSLGDYPPMLPRATGTAHFKPIPVTEDEGELDMVEATCEVFRNEAGEVVGFYASFLTRWGEPFLTDKASVTWFGKFAGPGQYDAARITYAYNNDISDSITSGTLVLDADGLTGHFKAPKAELEFHCGDDSKLSLATVPWPPLPERTMRIVDNDGTVYEFPGLSCGTSDGEFGIDTFGTPYVLRYTTDGTGTGTHRVGNTNMDYAGGVLTGSASTGGTLKLDCGATPVSGTINDDTTFACQR